MSEGDYYRPSFQELAGFANSKESIVVVCGAGLSHNVAPLADTVKLGLLNAVRELSSRVKGRSKAETDELAKKYFTLELFVSGLRHRVPGLASSLTALYTDIFTLPQLNRAHEALAKAMGKFTASGKRATILTANFDDGVSKALAKYGIEYRLITRNNVSQVMASEKKEASGIKKVDVCAYHGTIETQAPNDPTPPSPPTSMTARNLAHPFPPALSQYFQKTLAEAHIVLFIGHRGEDFYDLNVELKRATRTSQPSGASHDDGGQVSRKFVCIPHKADPSQVHKSYTDLFKRKGIACIKDIDGHDDWAADLFDEISGTKTDSTMAPPKEMTDAEWEAKADAEVAALSRKLISLVDSQVGTEGSMERWVMQRQCAALLDDIRDGALAAWTVIEHYRLESLGYSQAEISAFGRPEPGATYHGVPIDELLSLQHEYQQFRDRFSKIDLKDPGPTFNIVDIGLKLADRMERVALKAREALETTSEGTQKAMARLLAAIPYDYCGLVGMRLMKVFRVTHIPADEDKRPAKPPLDELLRRIDASTMRTIAAQAEPKTGDGGNGIGLRTELLFLTSASLATRAGIDLDTEAAKFFPDPARQHVYASSLSEIVGWQDWQFAPAENRLRLGFIPIGERLEGYRVKINERMARMTKEVADAAVSDGELTFSAAADAAQCAVRVCEVARMLADVEDQGMIPEGRTAALLEPKASQFLAEIPALARKCIRIAAETSSVRNHLIMQAYDALLLESLLTGRGNEIEIYREAAAYADEGTSPQFTTRLDGIRSRFPQEFGFGVAG